MNGLKQREQEVPSKNDFEYSQYNASYSEQTLLSRENGTTVLHTDF